VCVGLFPHADFVCMNAWELSFQNFKVFSFHILNFHLVPTALILCNYFYSSEMYVLKLNTSFEDLFKEKIRSGLMI
jgi:hypothetical protein